MTDKFEELIKQIEGMTTLELSQFVKALEEKFGVSAQTMMMAPPAGPTAGAAQATEAAEEKTSFNVILKDAGSQKIQVIKAIRELTGKGLKEAKDLTDKPSSVIKEEVKKEEAEEIKKKLEEAGAQVEIK